MRKRRPIEIPLREIADTLGPRLEGYIWKRSLIKMVLRPTSLWDRLTKTDFLLSDCPTYHLTGLLDEALENNLLTNLK